jgi:predicted permease
LVGTEVVPLSVVGVSESFLRVLGLSQSDLSDWRPAPPAAPRPLGVLTSGAARLAAAGGADARSLSSLDGATLTIAGRLPKAFLFPAANRFAQPDAITPVAIDDLVIQRVGARYTVSVIARLRPGVRIENVEAALSSEVASRNLRVEVHTLDAYLTGAYRELALGALVACLLISTICAANVVNLLLVRRMYRIREFATRESLGASRIDLARLMLVEIGVVIALGLACALALAVGATTALARVIPDEYALFGAPSVTMRVVVGAFVLGAIVVAMAAPIAWMAWRSKRVAALKEGLAPDSKRLRLLRSVATASQSAIAMLLLVTGVLFARSYALLWQQDSGFSGPVLSMSVVYPRNTPGVRVEEDIHATLQALARIPGVGSVAATTADFLNDPSILGGVMGGARLKIGDQEAMLPPKDVTPDFFATIGAKLIAGRPLGPIDRGWEAVVVDDALVHRLWPGRPPKAVVGSMLQVNGSLTGQVVGVVGAIRDRGMDRPLTGSVYRPLGATARENVHYLLRLSGASAGVSAQANRAARAVNPSVVILAASPLSVRLSQSVHRRTFVTMVIGLFTLAGLGMTASGLFGVTAFVVARRTREIAIRVAIGARSVQVRWLVLREAAFSHCVGALSGLGVGRLLAGTIESQLYGISANDSSSMLAAVAIIAAVGAAAALVPAQRALRISPSIALRIE